MKERIKSILMEAFQIWKVFLSSILIIASMGAVVAIIAFVVQFIIIHISGPFNIILGIMIALLSGSFLISLLIAIIDDTI